MNNKFLLSRKRIIPFFFAITTAIILIISCADPISGSASSSSAAVVTIPMLNYADINAVASSKFIRVYTTGSEFTSSTTFSNFAISPSGGATIDPNTGVTIDPSTGIVTVLTSAVDTDGTKYTVTADIKEVDNKDSTKVTATFTLKVLAADDVKALTEVPVYKTVEANATEGTVAVTQDSDGTPSTTIKPSGANKIPAPIFGDSIEKEKEGSINYSLVQVASADSSSISTDDSYVTDASGVAVKGITINANTGIITVSADASASISGTYKVYAEATGNYAGQQSATIKITILELGKLSYGSEGTVTVADDALLVVVPVWSVIQNNRSVGYATKAGTTLPTGVTLDVTTGTLTINGTTKGLDGKTATIIATGTGDYTGMVSEVTITISIKTAKITGTFSYSGTLSTSYGVAQDSVPTWSGATANQTATYRISPVIAGISVDAAGVVSVRDTASITASGDYTVTAQGSGEYGGSISAKISIEITPLAIAGTLSYEGATSFTQGSTGTSTATWNGATNRQTIAYSLSPENAGITVGTDGTITVANTVAIGKYPLTVTAVGNGNYIGTVSASITLTVTGNIVGTFSYGTIGVLSTATSGTSIQPQWSGATTGQTLRYTFASNNATPAGISLNATTGALIVYGDAVIAGTYSIDATGTGNYNGKIIGELTIQIRISEITGSFSYATVNTIYGTTKTSSTPIWIGETAGQTFTYSINSDAVSIDSTTGAVTISATTPVATTQYIVSAIGSGSYGGTKTATINIIVAKKTIRGSISYATTTTSVGTTKQVAATLTLDDADSTVSYAISPQDNGVSINASTGQVTIAPTTAAASKGYVISVTGIGNYTGSLNTGISIVVNGALSGSFSYPATSVTATGFSITINPEWTGANNAQTYTYSVTPISMISLNPNTGALTISAAGTYTVTATGTGLYLGSTKTTTVLVRSVQSYFFGAFNYGEMTSTYGSDITHAQPIWSGADVNQISNTNYTMTPNVTGISINAADGAITVSNFAAIGKYDFIVTATGTGDYAGNARKIITVVVSKKAIAGALSYATTTATLGSIKVASAVWSAEAINGQTLEYSISPSTSGIRIDNNIGTITITPTSVFDSTTYTVTATGTGNYSGSTSGTIAIKAIAVLSDNFSYDTTSVSTTTTSLQSKAVWTGVVAPSVSYAFSDGSTPSGLALNATTGTLTIDGSSAKTGIYNITATAVDKGLYTGTASGSIQITVLTDTNKSVTGTLSYGTISITYGSGTLAMPTWANVIQQTQNVEYSINPKVEGIHIDSATGVISVANTTNVSASASYIVTARGTRGYAGAITTNANITILQARLTGTITKYKLQAVAGTKAIGILPTWNKATIDQLQAGNISYSLQTTPNGVSIDSATGIITITENAVPQSTSITLIAVGQNNYTGSTVATGVLEVIGSISGASMHYQSLTIASKGATTSITTFAPDWTGLDLLQVRNHLAYSFDSSTTGQFNRLEISKTTGKITIDGTKVSSGVYTIKATGTGFYTGTVYGTISIQSIPESIVGTFSYPTSSSDTTSLNLLETTFGEAKSSEKPVWKDTARKGPLYYSINPNTAGISIDNSTGVVTIADTANVQLASAYTITVSEGGLGGEISTRLMIGVQGTKISGTFNYGATSIEYGTAISVAPTWNSPGANQTVKYQLSSPPTGVSINENTGVIRIANNTSASTTTDITVYAIGTGNYTDNKSSKLTLTIAKKTVEGTLTYDTIVQSYGTSKTYVATKTGIPTSQTGAYTIVDTAGQTIEGISIDSLGAITIGKTAIVSNAQNYTVTLTGSGNYTGTITTTLSITINAIDIAGTTLSYPATVVGNDNIALTPSWALTSSDVTYALLNPTPAGLAIDASGKVTITAANVAIGNYTITTNGKGNYRGTQTATLVVTKPATPTKLEGTLAYTKLVAAVDSAVLENNTSNPSGLTGTPTVIYSISPQTTGISIDSSSGTITVSKDAVPTSPPSDVTYTVTARGTGNTTGSTTANIIIHATHKICLLDNNLTDKDAATDGMQADISNWRQLASMGTDSTTMAGSYTLQNDIKMPNAGECSDYTNEGWEPLGNEDRISFQGTFDGQGYTISNYYMNGDDIYYGFGGLFGSLKDATLKNFTIDHVGILIGNDDGAAVAGLVEGDEVSIINVHVTSSNNSIIYGSAIIGKGVRATKFTAVVSSDSTIVVDGDRSEIIGGGLIREMSPNSRSATADITGYYSGEIIIRGEHKPENVKIGAFIGDNDYGSSLKIRGYYVNNSSGVLAVAGFVGSSYTEENATSVDMEVIVRASTVNTAYDNIAIRNGDVFSGTPVVYNSINETYLPSASFTGTTTIGTDVAYSSSLSKGDFANLTFGTAVGEWTWVEDGKFPAINIGSTAPVAEQPIEFIGNVNTPLDIVYNACERVTNRPQIENSIYQISNWKELRWIDNCIEGNFELTNDIYLPSPGSDPLYNINGWTPLFTEIPFRGILDGKGYAIRNFYANNSIREFGLISKVENVTIKNLKIVHSGVSFNTGGVFVGSADINCIAKIWNIGLEATNDEIVAAQEAPNRFGRNSGALVGELEGDNSFIRGYSTSKTNKNVAGLVGYVRDVALVGFTTNTNPHASYDNAHVNFVTYSTSDTNLKGYAITTATGIEGTVSGIVGKAKYAQLYFRDATTAKEGRMHHAATADEYTASTFTMTSTTTLTEFLAEDANKGFRDTTDATKLDSDWVWVADGNWPAINLLHPDHRDSTAAGYVAPLVAPADQPIGIE